MSRGDRIAPILLVAHDLRKLRSGKNIAEPLERTSRYSRGTAGEKTTRHQQCYGSTCYRKIIYRRQSTRQITGCFIWRAADRCSARYQPTGRAPTDRRGVLWSSGPRTRRRVSEARDHITSIIRRRPAPSRNST